MGIEQGANEATMAVAFDEVYHDAYEPLVRLAYFLVGSPGLAEEAVQDVFVRAFERWSSIDDHVAYLRVAVVNRCRSLHRRRFVAARWQRSAGSAGGIDDHLDDHDELSDVLARLPRRRREVVVLRFYADLPLNEVARLLGIRDSTARATLHHALAELKEVLS